MIINDDIKKQVSKVFEMLAHPVRLIVFTQEQECRHCQDLRLMVEEIVSTSPSLSMEVLDFVADKDRADKLGIDKIPALAVVGQEDYGIRFFGLPAGYEFTSLVEAIKAAGSDGPVISADGLAELQALAGPVNIQVFVTPTCPYCPAAVVAAHRLARSSQKISASMVEATEFPHLSVKYAVRTVPKIILNEVHEFTGAFAESEFVKRVLKAGEDVKPA